MEYVKLGQSGLEVSRRPEVAVAWMARKPGVTGPIVGASRPGHIEDAVAALSLDLGDEEIAMLEAPYVAHAVAGF